MGTWIAGRAWVQAGLGRLGKAGRASNLPFTPLPHFLKVLLDLEHLKKMLSPPGCLGKLEAVGASPQECGVHILWRKDLPNGPRFRGLA